jgi:cytochrome c oxidase subunit 3
MSAITHEHHEEAHGHELPWSVQLKANRLGLWLFCFSEVFLFAALLVARFALWLTEDGAVARPELSQPIGLFATVVLLVSSFFVYRGETAMEHGDRKTFLNSYLMAAFLGTLFFIGVVFLEWNVLGLNAELFGIEIFGHLKPTDGVWGAVFYAMTGMHSLHVLTGIIFLLVVWNNGRNGHYDDEKHWGVEACAIYWHYVDVVWVFFYPALYLMGHAVAA